MAQSLLNDVIGVIQNVFLGGDLVSLLIAFGSVLVAGLAMQRAVQLVGMTAMALILFILASAGRAVFGGPAPEGSSVSGRAVGQFETGWVDLMGMQAGAILAYFLAFMVLILVLFVVKSIVAR
ncbi:MAG: hypothetical protein AAF224_12755 [Pseudomonadota bacterium]